MCGREEEEHLAALRATSASEGPRRMHTCSRTRVYLLSCRDDVSVGPSRFWKRLKEAWMMMMMMVIQPPLCGGEDDG
ncbi:unnamed protein product [Ectocarpus sp. 6 AP-2014]